jgi:hypothetical protein
MIFPVISDPGGPSNRGDVFQMDDAARHAAGVVKDA